MVTLRELQDLRLGKLATAVSHWEQTVRKLTALAQGGDGDVNAADFAAKAKAADWKGDNATVTKAFTTTTARQFTDVLTEARSIHAVLRDAHTALAGHQRALVAALERWHAKGVRFDGRGRAHGVIRHADNSSPDEPVPPEELQAASSEVIAILEAASETDRIASRALHRHARNPYDFDEAGYQGLGDADRGQGVQDADALLRLARKGDGMTEAELRRFDAIMAYQRDNPAFAERFATKLGAEGTLAFWHGLADPKHSFPPHGERAKILADVQENLSLTLATASRVDSPAMSEWRAGVIAAGDDRFGPGGPYGYHVMSSLMTKGKWDTGFLTSYGERLVEFERSSDRRGGPQELWHSPASVPFRLTYPHDPGAADNDPLNGFLEALGHNPEASLEFFRGHTGGDGGNGPRYLDNFDYLVGRGDDPEAVREWPIHGDGKTAGYERLGHALEAATLGYPYDAVSPQVPPAGTPDQVTAREYRTALMDRVVSHYGSSDLIDKQDGIRPSLARMAAGHIDSLNYSVDNFGGSGEATGRNRVYGSDRYHLTDFGRTDSTAFLRALASDREAYETVSAAQQLYGTSTMAAQGDATDTARRVGMHGVYMHGLLDEARSEAIGKEFADDAERRNLELEKQAAWRGFVTSALVGAGVGAGTALVTGTGVGAVLIPIAIETVGGAVETQVQTQMMDWLKANKYDNSAEAVSSLGDAREHGEIRAAGPLLAWAQARGMSPSDVRSLMDDAEERYVAGGQLVDTENRRGW